jgi:hypothetical protein
MEWPDVAIAAGFFALGVVNIATAGRQARAADGRRLGPVPLNRSFYVAFGVVWLVLAALKVVASS